MEKHVVINLTTKWWSSTNVLKNLLVGNNAYWNKIVEINQDQLVLVILKVSYLSTTTVREGTTVYI